MQLYTDRMKVAEYTPAQEKAFREIKRVLVGRDVVCCEGCNDILSLKERRATKLVHLKRASKGKTSLPKYCVACCLNLINNLL